MPPLMNTWGKGTLVGLVAVVPPALIFRELRELFIWDSVRFGCVSEDEAKWLRLNRRKTEERSEEETNPLPAR